MNTTPYQLAPLDVPKVNLALSQTELKTIIDALEEVSYIDDHGLFDYLRHVHYQEFCQPDKSDDLNPQDINAPEPLVPCFDGGREFLIRKSTMQDWERHEEFEKAAGL